MFTDGASQANQWRSLRRAGVGAFWGHHHPFNVSEAFTGEEQTNNRAELTAVIRVLQLEVRPLEIRTDSGYVHQGVLRHMPVWKARNWTTRSKRPVCNVDLWMTLEKLLAERTEGNVHAKDADVVSGKVLREDKIGNDCADMLAVAGALLHKTRGVERRQAQIRLDVAWKIQRLMVDIVRARAASHASRGRQPETSGTVSQAGSESDSESESESESLGTFDDSVRVSEPSD